MEWFKKLSDEKIERIQELTTKGYSAEKIALEIESTPATVRKYMKKFTQSEAPEHKPVKEQPKVITSKQPEKESVMYQCGNCAAQFPIKVKYCPECGNSCQWE